MKARKHGVSLIVLIITIIVMIILAGTIILSLDDTGIIKRAQKAVDVTNEKEVQQFAGLLWAEAYIEHGADDTKIQEYIEKGFTENGISLEEYAVVADKKGVLVSYIPENWRGGNVIVVVDEVPIPKGFVASNATGENKKNTGLVIYEGERSVDNSNVEEARRSRNQYVWVPVEDFSKFVRQNFGRSDVISNTLGSGYWEVVLDTATNMPLSTQSTSYVTSTTLAEVQAMYESVKEYKGFYIARYEAGIDTQRTAKGNAEDLPGIKEGTTVYSVMGKIPYTYIPWAWNGSMAEDTNGAVEVARSIYPETNTNYGVVSTLTYGVQWDTILQWWLDTKAVTSVTDSTSYGNYSNHVIVAGDLNDGAKYAGYDNYYELNSYQDATTGSTKDDETSWALSTGALKVASVNNIYDMAGNMWELTMEGSYAGNRGVRGGALDGNGSSRPSSRRYGITPIGENYNFGFRPTLYIKK